MKHGKKYNETAKLVDRATQYEPAEAIALVAAVILILRANKMIIQPMSQSKEIKENEHITELIEKEA